MQIIVRVHMPPPGGRNSVNQHDMGCVYTTWLLKQRQAWSTCDTSSSEYLSYCIGVNKFLCSRKGSSSTFLSAHRKYVPAKIAHTHKFIARPHRCRHRCCGMPLYLNKINDRQHTLCLCIECRKFDNERHFPTYVNENFSIHKQR